MRIILVGVWRGTFVGVWRGLEGVLCCFAGDVVALAGLLAMIWYFSPPSFVGEIWTATMGRAVCSGTGGDLNQLTDFTTHPQSNHSLRLT